MGNGEIFIVDDNLNNLKLLEDILNRNSYRVRMANSGERALKAIQMALPDLIMLDITMPQMDGFMICQKLKEDPQTANVPVIFISALDDVHDKIKAFQVGGVDYVTKPFQSEEVLVRVESQLKISRLQQELIRSNEELAKKNNELLQSYQKLEQLYTRGNQIFSAFTEILPGMILDDKYHLERIIGSGAFGTVFQAVNLELHKPVALKILKPSSKQIDTDIERFRTEGKFICSLSHPSAVSVFDLVCSSSGIIYMVMELLNGFTLEKELQEKKTLPLSRCFSVISPVCAVLAEAHNLGIIHCDIKAENIFLHQGKTGEVVKVLDFGISKWIREEENFDLRKMTLSEDLFGTPTYIAPERIQNLPYDGRADVYSLGVIVYRMLAGRFPIQAQNASPKTTTIMQITEIPAPLHLYYAGIPHDLETLVMECLEKDPKQRPIAEEFAQRFEEILKLNSDDDTRRIKN